MVKLLLIGNVNAMSRTNFQYSPIANDNDPAALRPLGDAVGFNRTLKDSEFQRHASVNEISEPSEISQTKPITNWVPILAFTCLTLSALAVLYTITMGSSPMTIIVCLAALTWSGLWAAYLSETASKPRSLVFCTLVASLGGLGIWAICATKLGLPIPAADGAAIFGGITLLVGFLMRSKMAVIISACCTLAWLALYLQLDEINRISFTLLPLLALMQIILAARYKAVSASLTACLAAYIWLGWQANMLIQTNTLPLLNILTTLALVGLVHFRAGKAAGDKNVHHSNLHVTLGWAVAFGSLIALQQYWLGDQGEFWSTASISTTNSFVWKMTTFALLSLICITATIRWLAGRSSMMGVIIATSAATVLAYSTINPEALSQLWFENTGLLARPSFGFILAGVTAASAIGMIINGTRLGNIAMVLLGFIVVAAVIYQFSTPRFWTEETLLILGLSTLISLCCIGLMVSDSHNKITKKVSRKYTTRQTKTPYA